MTPEHHKESPLMTSQSFSEEHQELVFRAPRGDSGIGDTLPEPLQLQRVNETADIAFEMSFDGSIASIPSVLSSPGRSCAAAKCSLVSSYSTEPLSSDHEHSAFSNSDTAAGEGGGDRSSPDIEADGAREQDSKQGGKKRKHSLKHLVEEQASSKSSKYRVQAILMILSSFPLQQMDSDLQLPPTNGSSPFPMLTGSMEASA